jgi:hypothetical protein
MTSIDKIEASEKRAFGQGERITFLNDSEGFEFTGNFTFSAYR